MEDKPIIYNKELGISSEDILKLENIEDVKKVKKGIELQLAAYQLKFSKYERKTAKQKQYISSLLGLKQLCKSKIDEHLNELKERGVWKTHKEMKSQRHLASVFMMEAKQILPKDVYQEILRKSQEMIEKEK